MLLGFQGRNGNFTGKNLGLNMRFECTAQKLMHYSGRKR
jgi:hypothetical protein